MLIFTSHAIAKAANRYGFIFFLSFCRLLNDQLREQERLYKNIVATWGKHMHPFMRIGLISFLNLYIRPYDVVMFAA